MDITERKRGEPQRARLAAILFASDDAIIGTAPDGTVMAWNAGAERIFGYREAEALGRPIFLLTPPDQAEEDQRLATTVLAGQRIRQLDTVRLTKDGRPINVSLTVSPVEDDRGTIVAVSIVVRDITERRRAEEHQRMLLAELSHRARTPSRWSRRSRCRRSASTARWRSSARPSSTGCRASRTPMGC